MMCAKVCRMVDRRAGIPLKERLKSRKKSVRIKAAKLKAQMKEVGEWGALVGLSLFYAALLCGCQSSTPASRANSTEYGAINIAMTAVTNGTVTITYSGDGVLASADGGGDTQTASPVSTVAPSVSVPVNKAGASQSVGSVIGDAVARLLSGRSGSGGTAGACEDCEDVADCPDCVDR